MGSYSPERKAAVIARMLPPHSQSIYQISRLEGIPAWKAFPPIRFMAGGLRLEFRLSRQPVRVNSTWSGLRMRASPLSLKPRRFLLMLWLNTVAVKASILNRFSSGRTSLCSQVSVQKEP